MADKWEVTTIAFDQVAAARDAAHADADAASAHTVACVVTAFALGQAIHAAGGTLHPAGIVWLAVAMACALAAVMLKPERLAIYFGWIGVRAVLAMCLTIQWAQLLAWGATQLGPRPLFMLGMLIAGGGAALLACREKIALSLLVIGHLIAGAVVIHSTPKLVCDAHMFQQESAAALLRGENPYTVPYRSVYPTEANFYGPGMVVNGYLTYSHPYPPLTLLLAAPARAFGDVRWAHLVALELAAILIFAASRNRSFGLAYAALLLLTPRSLYVILAGWTEPMVVAALAFVAYTAMRAPRWTWFSLGLLLATKQYAVLLLPLAPLLLPQPWAWRDATKLIARAVGVAAGITLPFLLWDPPAFLRSVVAFQFVQPFRTDSLSFPALVAQLTGVHLGSSIAFLLAAAMLILLRRRAIDFMSAAAVVFLVFFAFNKQAFANYYFLVIAACCMAVANAIPRQDCRLTA